VDVTTAGTLSTLLTSEEDTTITSLTVTGSIDARDFKFIRDKMTNLTALNIKKVTIQAYNGTDGTSTLNITSYPANEIPESAFFRCNGTVVGEALKLKSIILPDFVRSIGHFAFSSCNGLTSITIPNPVTSIGSGAFMGCNISKLTIGNSVITIGDNAFSGCTKLTSIELPNSVNLIGHGAFSCCFQLTSIYSNATTPPELSGIYSSMNTGVFSSVNINACTLHVPAGSKAAYQAAGQWGDFYIVEMTPTASQK
jgi:hypothetical protein